MLYRLFLYNTNAFRSSPVIGEMNHAVAMNSDQYWRSHETARYMAPFDSESVARQIEKELTDPVAEQCKCRCIVEYPPKMHRKVSYIFLATSFEKAAEVLPRVHAIAAENGLVMYDAELNRTYYRELVDVPYITMQTRQQALRLAITESVKPVWSVRCILLPVKGERKECAYAITLRKDAAVSFGERNERFYACLRDNLAVGEKLTCEDRCYTVSGHGYSVTYVLEGYKKQPDRIGFVENGVPKTALLHRMGVEAAYRWTEECGGVTPESVLQRTVLREMRKNIPNPGTRYVVSAKISKWIRKLPIDIGYRKLGPCGSAIRFHVVPDRDDPAPEEVSVLAIEESDAGYILPFIHDVYPYFMERYYLTPNHLPAEMWWRIMERLRKAKNMILHDTFNPELEPYIVKFPYYNTAELLYSHRFEAVLLIDIFLQWSEAQLDAYECNDDLMFNIQGP